MPEADNFFHYTEKIATQGSHSVTISLNIRAYSLKVFNGKVESALLTEAYTLMFITFGTALIILKLLPKFQAPVFIF